MHLCELVKNCKQVIDAGDAEVSYLPKNNMFAIQPGCGGRCDEELHKENQSLSATQSQTIRAEV